MSTDTTLWRYKHDMTNRWEYIHACERARAQNELLTLRVAAVDAVVAPPGGAVLDLLAPLVELGLADLVPLPLLFRQLIFAVLVTLFCLAGQSGLRRQPQTEVVVGALLHLLFLASLLLRLQLVLTLLWAEQ